MTQPDAAPAVPPYRPLVVASRFFPQTCIRVLAARLIMEVRGAVTCCDWRQVALGPVTQRFGIRQMELRAGAEKCIVDSFSFAGFDALRRAVQERMRVSRWASMRALHLLEHDEPAEGEMMLAPMEAEEPAQVA